MNSEIPMTFKVFWKKNFPEFLSFKTRAGGAPPIPRHRRHFYTLKLANLSLKIFIRHFLWRRQYYQFNNQGACTDDHHNVFGTHASSNCAEHGYTVMTRVNGKEKYVPSVDARNSLWMKFKKSHCWLEILWVIANFWIAQDFLGAYLGKAPQK